MIKFYYSFLTFNTKEEISTKIMINNKTLIKNIKLAIEAIPGIVDYNSLDFSNSNSKNENWIFLEEIDKKINVKLAIIIGRNVSTKNLLKEIQQTLSYIFKKEKILLGNVDLYVKGVK